MNYYLCSYNETRNVQYIVVNIKMCSLKIYIKQYNNFKTIMNFIIF